MEDTIARKTPPEVCKTLCLLFAAKCTILIGHTCRCDEMVDVADSKSAASDGVPVRVRSPAPKKQIPEPGICFFASWADENPSNCNTPVGCCSFPARRERHLYFLRRRKCKSTSTRRCCASEQPPEGRLLASRSPVTGAGKFHEFGHRHQQSKYPNRAFIP